jgi:hypothetical protein
MVVKMKIDLKNKKTIGGVVALVAAAVGAAFMGSGVTVEISTCEAGEATTSAPSAEEAETPAEAPATPPAPAEGE